MLKRIALILPFLLALQSFKVSATVAFFLTPSTEALSLHAERYHHEAFAFNALMVEEEELNYLEELTEEEEDELESSSYLIYRPVGNRFAYGQTQSSSGLRVQKRKLFILYNSRKVDCGERAFRG